MKVAKVELSRECDYELEATNQKRFRSLLSDAKGFYVPLVVDDLSCKRVLSTEFVSGVFYYTRLVGCRLSLLGLGDLVVDFSFSPCIFYSS